MSRAFALALALGLSTAACDSRPFAPADQDPLPVEELVDEDLALGDTGLAPSTEDPTPDAADDTAEDDQEAHAPQCRIETPADGDAFAPGTSVHFAADVADQDGDLAYVLWTSSVYGTMVVGDAFDFILTEGEHAIVLEVADKNGKVCTDEVVIFVEP